MTEISVTELEPWTPTDREIDEKVLEALPGAVTKQRTFFLEHRDHWQNKLNLMPVHVRCSLLDNISSGTYLVDNQIVIKPADEDILCVNNPTEQDGMSTTPFVPGADRVRTDIPLGFSAERECASYEISQFVGLPLIPFTCMALVESPDFFDISTSFESGKWKELFAKHHREPFRDRVSLQPKLCSWRDYVAHATSLSAFLDDMEGSEDCIDRGDIQAGILLMWILGHQDGHRSNILVVPKGVTSDGNPLYGLLLIDLCLTLPEKNSYCYSALPHTFEKPEKLDSWALAWIETFPLEGCIDILRKYELDASIDAFRERIEKLKKVAAEQKSIEEIHRYFENLDASSSNIFNFHLFSTSSTWTTTTTTS